VNAVGVGVSPFNLSLAALLEPTGFKAHFFDRSADFQWHPGIPTWRKWPSTAQ